MALDLSMKNSDLRHQTFSYQGIGKTFIAMSEYGKAFDQFKKAESLFNENLDYSAKGSMMNALSELNEKYGNIELALDYRIRAYELFKKDGHQYGQLASISDLARLHAINGNDDAAEAYLSDGENLARKINDEFHLARIYEQKGNLYFLRSENHIARAYLEKAYALFQRKKATRPVNRVKQELGMIDIKTDRINYGRSLLDEAYVFSRKIGDKYAQSEILLEFGRLSRFENKTKVALDYAKQSIELSDDLYSDVSNSKLQSLYFSGAIARYEFYVYLLMQQQKESPDDKNKVLSLQAAERSRARMLLERLWLLNAPFLKDASAELVTQEKDVRITLNSKTDQIAGLLSSSENSSKTLELAAEIRNLENKLEEIKAELKQKSPIYSAIKNPEPFDVADFQANVLDEDSLLLEFSLGKEESYLWAVDKADVAAYYLPPRGAIEAKVERLRSLIGARQLKQGEAFEDYQKRMADADVEYRSEARALSNDLLGQAKEKLAGKKLIVVADGRLHYFPLGSLPMPNSESDDPILLTNEVVYEPSASALKIFRMEKKAEAKPQKDLLVFADPVFSKSDERIVGLDTSNSGFVSTILSTFRSIESLESMARLPASREEAQSISDVVGANQTTVRAGFAANRDGVLNGGIEDYKILHFATHGLIDEKRPELSGILLSLFDNEGKQNDGGFIRLQDVYGLRLNSDLVVLSACDTGIGKEIKGEGVMSLNNAFLQAGAKSVVSSLWKVDDTATKDLMTEFYRGMADDNLTAAAALRGAQIKMYKDPRYRSPFYWAAFTASGDTTVKVAFTSHAWLYASISAAIVFAAAFLALFAFRRRSRRI
ncbi:MAG: CHAT domain-containing protein [Pyrinomonadaceae bacterium]